VGSPVSHTVAVAERSDRVARRQSRRGLVIGSGLAALGIAGYAVEEQALPGRSFLNRHLGLDGPDGVIPDVEAGHRVSGSFVSGARGGRRCGWTIAYPPGACGRLPVAVVLHGRGNSHVAAFSPDYLGLDRFLAQAVRRGAPPYAMASVDGGETYWHARADGEDSGAMVVDEFLPLLGDHGLDVSRVASSAGRWAGTARCTSPGDWVGTGWPLPLR
jgi:hypothetical protein